MKKLRVFLAIGALALSCAASSAGPFDDFESQAQKAYSAYRKALFSTNFGDKSRAVGTIQKFDAAWRRLAGDWKVKPPPQYASDKQYGDDLDKVAGIATKSLAEAKGGALRKSHETLEKIRDILADLRKRNGIVWYSDHVNAYHAQMERMIGQKYGKISRKLIGEVAVLDHLAQSLGHNSPARYRADPNWAKAYEAMLASVQNLQKALATNDFAAVQAAIKRLKKPYAKLFIGWG